MIRRPPRSTRTYTLFPLTTLFRARQSGLVFVLTHTYTGYPMVRHARDLVAQGEIGEVRLVQVEYSQDWWAEAAAQNDAGWRGNPRVAGPAGTLGDVGTHAYQLACYVSGMRSEERRVGKRGVGTCRSRGG